MSPGCYDQYNDETLSSTLSANVHCYSLPFCRVLNARQDSSNCFLFFFPNPWSVSDQWPESVSAALIKAQLVCVLCTCLNVPYLSVFALCLSVYVVIVCMIATFMCVLCSFVCSIQCICLHRVFSLVSYSSSLCPLLVQMLFFSSVICVLVFFVILFFLECVALLLVSSQGLKDMMSHC